MMRRAVLALSVVLAGAGSPAGAEPATVRLKPQAQVRGEWITLGAVADLSGGDAETLAGVKLGRAPLAGVERVLTRDDIAARLASTAGGAGLVHDPEGASAVRVSAAVKAVAGEELVRFGRTFLESRLPWRDAEVTIEEPQPPRTLAVPEGEVRFAADVSPRRLAGLVPVAVEVFSDDRRLARLLLSYRVHVRKLVPQAARDLAPGETVTDSDVVAVPRDLASVPEDAFLERDDLIGLKVARPVKERGLFRPGVVTQPKQVRRGAPVTLLARVGPVEARAPAQAKEDGMRGDVILVVNLNSKRTVQARVAGPGLVEAVMP